VRAASTSLPPTDNSHDLAEIPTFLSKLQSGYDLAIGNRFTGGIQPGAMPRLHRYLGSPVLTRVGQLFFRRPCGDQQCGFRGWSGDDKIFPSIAKWRSPSLDRERRRECLEICLDSDRRLHRCPVGVVEEDADSAYNLTSAWLYVPSLKVFEHERDIRFNSIMRSQVAAVDQSTIPHPISPAAAFRSFLENYFFFVMSLLMAAIVVVGFGPTVNRVMIHPAVPPPAILWVHAAAFSGWVLFFIFQSALVRTRNVKWHRRCGWFGVALGAFIVPLGIATAIAMTRFAVYRKHMVAGASIVLVARMMEMGCFAPLFVLAIAQRKKPELHRRLLFIATCVLLSAAFGRFPYLSTHLGLPYVAEDALILLGVLRDFVVDRRVHSVYLITLPILIVCQKFVDHLVNADPSWLRIMHGIIG
jgi:hypothetical protein